MMKYHFYESLYMDKDDFENHTPIERLENFYKVLKHRRLTSTDSEIMAGDLEEFKTIINAIIKIDMKWLRCEKCGISSEEVSLISEADICYQCEEESEVK